MSRRVKVTSTISSRAGVCAPCTHNPTGLVAMAMIPLIAVAGFIQSAMLTGRYGDSEVAIYKV